jgi:hypothetical protein
VRGLAVGANFVLFRPTAVTAHEVWQGCSTARAGAQLLVVAPPRRLPAGHHRHPDEDDAFLAAIEEVLA